MFHRFVRRAFTLSAAASALAFPMLLVSGCLGADASSERSAVEAKAEGEVTGLAEEALTDACNKPVNCNNCVYYARCRKPSLPYGLITFEDKKAIINTYTPEVGAVAIIQTRSEYGHVAYVEAVEGETITLSEGNWSYGSCGQRTGTVESLHIVGFFM